MSIDFFLHSKKIYKQIEFNLKDIVHLYEEFIELTESEEITCAYNKDEDIHFLKNVKNDYNERIKQIKFFKDYVNRKIIGMCEHNFVKDSIDISPDESQEIEYCTFCEYTKK